MIASEKCTLLLFWLRKADKLLKLMARNRDTLSCQITIMSNSASEGRDFFVLLSSLLSPNQAHGLSHGDARPLAGQPESLGSAQGSREEGFNSWKREIQSQQQTSTNHNGQ